MAQLTDATEKDLSALLGSQHESLLTRIEEKLKLFADRHFAAMDNYEAQIQKCVDRCERQHSKSERHVRLQDASLRQAGQSPDSARAARRLQDAPRPDPTSGSPDRFHLKQSATIAPEVLPGQVPQDMDDAKLEALAAARELGGATPKPVADDARTPGGSKKAPNGLGEFYRERGEADKIIWDRKIEKARKHQVKRNIQRSKQKKRRADSFLTDRSAQAFASTDKLFQIATDTRFELASAMLILFNVFYLYIQAEHSTRSVEAGVSDRLPIFTAFDVIFCLIFLGELVFRLMAFGTDFVYSKDWPWNLLDTIVVVASIIELILEASFNGQTLPLTPLRMLRLLRVFRSIRIVRAMNVFRELRTIFVGMMGAMRTLVWVALLLLAVIYFFALLLTMLYVQAYEDQRSTSEWDDDIKEQFQIYMSGTRPMLKCMMTLFMCVSGGIDWMSFWDVLWYISMGQSFFLMYVVFVSVGLLNLITGLFVDAAMVASTQDRDVQLRNKLGEQDRYLRDMEELFHELDVDKTGTITLDEFERHLNDERALAYFESIELDVTEAAMIFRLLDMDQNGSVDLREFIGGCQRLRGEARSLDTAVVRMLLEHLSVDLLSFALQTQKGVEKLLDDNGLDIPRRHRSVAMSLMHIPGQDQEDMNV